MDADNGDIFYVSEGRELSRGKMGKRLYELQKKTSYLWNQKGNLCQNLKMENGSDLAFFMDLTAHLNELNIHLQGENQLTYAVFQTITKFKMKLKLWQAEVMANNVLMH